MRRDRAGSTGLLGAIVLAGVLILTACSGCATTDERVNAAVRPRPPDLSTPERAVRAYTDWISYAYRTLDADIASPTVTPSELVRIDSYVEYNREKGRAIEQRLLGADYRSLAGSASTKTVSGRERWTYRYLTPDGSRYLGISHQVSYDVTYTVVATGAGLWVVDKVEAARQGR